MNKMETLYCSRASVAQWLQDWLSASNARLLLVFGAGMSVDAGIPDYRGSQGLYTPNSPLADGDPEYMQSLQGGDMRLHARASWKKWWGLYRIFLKAQPHVGYLTLANMVRTLRKDYFVLTTNVDQMSHRSGFAEDRIHACHGNMFYLQCSSPCSREVWPFDIQSLQPKGEEQSAELPRCPRCGVPARPNVYFFGDSERSYVWEEAQKQADAFASWLAEDAQPTNILEIGCGLASPGMRRRNEDYAAKSRAPVQLVRINEHDPIGEAHEISSKLSPDYLLCPMDSKIEFKPSPEWQLIAVKCSAAGLFE